MSANKPLGRGDTCWASLLWMKGTWILYFWQQLQTGTLINYS